MEFLIPVVFGVLIIFIFVGLLLPLSIMIWKDIFK